MRNKLLKKFVILAICISGFHTADAKIYVDNNQAGSQYLAYPVPEKGIPSLSATPEGYIPFHMEHYGRHGSRWRINPKEYSTPLFLLTKAKENNKLTARGEQLLEEIRLISEDSKSRLGELTPLGHRQHRGIASRMAHNFPEIFNDSTILDAKSTEVIRCILSMANEVAEFQKLFPLMNITMDASQTTQNILNYNPNDTIVYVLTDAARPILESYRATLPKPDKFFDNIFTDREFVRDSLGEAETFKAIFDLAVNVQSHDSYPEFFDVFTEEEINNEWLARNAEWYIRIGNTPLTKNRNPYNQRVLLRNIIESADTAMMSPAVSANLRFGHETMLSPLSVLMELNNSGYETEDLSSLADNWRAYEIFPMGSNIQLVFYRPDKEEYDIDDILIKVLLNEAEATLPINPVDSKGGKYYRWSELRKYYMDKLDGFHSKFDN